MKLGAGFYQRDDVVTISQELLGKYLYTKINGEVTVGMIVETEAYSGRNDKACHAHANRRTNRTKIMYEAGGVAYVYLCYGIHHLFNIITNVKGQADAVLIRAIEPKIGIEKMLERRKMVQVERKLTAGPGIMSQAMGIDLQHYGESLLDGRIWIEDNGNIITENQVIKSPRVGVAYAEEDAKLPWRFRIADNVWTSKAK